MELLQVSLEIAWKLLLQIPIPWRFLLFLSVILFGFPWLIVRGLPYILIKFSQTVLFLFNGLAVFLLLPESLLSQYIRQKGYQPPRLFYLFGVLLGSIVRLFNSIYQTFNHILRYALRKPWILKRGWLLTLSGIFSILWFFQPVIQQASTRRDRLPSNQDRSTPHLSPKFVVQAGAGYANLRSLPSTETTIIAKIPNGTPVTILRQEMNSSNQRWYQVQINGRIGWIFSGLIEQR